MQDITKMVLIEAGDRLVDRSPVGDPPSWKKQPAHPPPNYRPGRFKNNWQLGVNSFPTDVYMTSDPSGELSKTRIRLAIPRFPMGNRFYFINNLPYASELEHGHSQQCPPGGMVALLKMEFKSIAQDCVARYKAGERPIRKDEL